MSASPDLETSRPARWLAWAVALLLVVRFSASSALIGVNLSPPTLVTVGAALEAYEVLVPFLLLPVFFFLLGRRDPPVSFRATVAALALLGAGLVTWLLAILGVLVPLTTQVFLVLAVASVAAGAWLAYPFPPARRQAMRPWTPTVYGVLLAALPVVLAMRLAALEGLDPVTGSGGVLRGNWFFVHAPTIALEFLVIAVFVNVLFDRSTPELRRRWYAFLPFLLVPVIMDAVSDRPLTGYVLSALITWGANIALFSPAIASIGLVTAVFACFASAFLLLGRKGKTGPWDLLFLGSASLFFAGFYPSMASVVGLDVALLLVHGSIRGWPPGADSVPASMQTSPLAARE